jgi:hypothetical protein
MNMIQPLTKTAMLAKRIPIDLPPVVVPMSELDLSLQALAG